MVENIEELLRPPKVMTADGGFDLQILPGKITVRATCPGYQIAELPMEVPNGRVPGPVKVLLKERSTPSETGSGL
jgi:hypothetical protein